MKTYQKVRFTSKLGATAGLVIECSKLEGKSVQDVSRFFPYGEAMKMARLETSPAFNSWEEAFAYDFSN